MVNIRKYSATLIVKFMVVLLFVVIAVFLFDSQASVNNLPAQNKTVLKEKQGFNLLLPTKEQSITSKDIISNLKNYHYIDTAFDDKLSSKFLDHYLSDLDNQRIFFNKDDINEFEKLRYRLDNYLKQGDLLPGFFIFNRYQERYAQRLTFLLDQLKDGIDNFDFTIDETIEVDREDAPWAADTKALHKLWRQRLKNDILNLKLSKKTDKEISELLSKRYKYQLSRGYQTKGEDAYRIYMNALTMSIDPHTQYFSPRLTENFNIQMRLSLEGIGAMLQTDEEYTKIVRLVHAGPAEKSKKLSPGDRITGVGQGAKGNIVDVVGWRIDDVVDLIRGPKNTVVQLQIIPADAVDDHNTKIVSITRGTVKLEDQAASKKVTSFKNNGQTFKIGVIEIPTFYIDFQALQNGDPEYKSTTRDVRRLLLELEKEKVDGIVVDLRNNGGGSLQEANELTGLFIKSGPTVQIRSLNGQTSKMNDPDPKIVYDGPLAILINRMSASASEIFAGAIQDYGRGIIIGTQTFGKGTVQSLRKLDHGQLKLTIATFYRVSGQSTQHRGVIPNIVFPEIYDKEEIGESSLPEAIPWDTIKPVRFNRFSNFAPFINELRKKHKERINDSIEFACIVEEIDRTRSNQNKTSISLHEKTRKKEKEELEKWRIDLENKRRKVRGEKPIKSMEELEKENDPYHDKKDDDKEYDPMLVEAENILIDYIKLEKKQK